MLHIPDAKCRFETFMAAVELITKDLVEVTIVYIVVDTLLIAPFKKDGVEVWLNEAKVAFPGVSNIMAELPPGGDEIKELIVALPTTHGIANAVVTFVVRRCWLLAVALLVTMLSGLPGVATAADSW